MWYRNLIVVTLVFLATQVDRSAQFCARRKHEKPLVTTNGERKGVILHMTSDGDVEQLDKSKATYMTIIEKSMDMLVQSEDEEHVHEFLDDFYFTTDGDSSIWAKALTERKQDYSKHVKKLKRMQDIVKTLFEKWLDCKDSKGTRKQCKCYFEMHSLLDAGQKEFKLGGNNVQRETLLFDMNIAYSMMSLIVYHLTIHVAIFAPTPAITIRNAYFKVAEHMLDNLDGVIKNITDARADRVSDVEICHTKVILFHEYTDKCECYNCNRKPDKSKSSTSPSPSSSSGDDDYNIDGDGALEKFTAKVIDRANGTVICDEKQQAKSNDGQRSVELDLYSACSKLKMPYTRKLKKETERYYTKRIQKIRSDLPTLWGINKKKYAKFLSQ